MIVHCTAGATGYFFALWPSACWWHEGDDGIHYSESTTIQHHEDEVLQNSEGNGAGLALEGLRVSWNITSLRIHTNGLSCEEWDDANNECHQQHSVSAEIHAYLRPFWRVALVLSQLIHTHAECQEEDGKHGCEGHSERRSLQNLLDGQVVILQPKAIGCHTA
jgi:hypothetical protein